MAVDEQLTVRLREQLDARAVPFTEKSMFGSLAFLVEDEIVLSVRGSGDLLVRCGTAETETLRSRDGVSPARMGRRTMSEGWLDVDAATVAEDDSLAGWVEVALHRLS